MQKKYNSKSRSNNNNKFDNSADLVNLGTFSHKCGNLFIVKLAEIDIPYPNAFIFDNNKHQVGKVEEIFGLQNDVHVAIKMEKKANEFNIYSNKLIPRNRFLERSDVEKKKEANDKKRKIYKKDVFKQDFKYKKDTFDKNKKFGGDRKFGRNGKFNGDKKFGGDRNNKRGKRF